MSISYVARRLEGRVRDLERQLGCKTLDVEILKKGPGAVAFLTNVISRINNHPALEIDKLLPWRWQA